MKRHFKYSANIERYLSNEMAYGEKKSFEKEVALNPELSGELKFTQSIDDAIKRDDVIDFRKKLISVRRENSENKSEVPVVPIQRKKFWYAAASLVLLAGLGSALFFNTSGEYSNDDLFRKYYTSENIIDVTRSGDANIVEAVFKFQQKDYRSSASLFRQILEKDKGNIAGWFYYGISCIETEEYGQAEAAFGKIIAENQNLYIEHAEWYLGLCYLKSNQSVKAKQQLEKIASNPDNFHRQDAKHLLERLAE